MPSLQFNRANSDVEISLAFIEASTARRRLAEKGKEQCASNLRSRFNSPLRGRIRTSATSTPSAEAPLISPATIIGLADGVVFTRASRPSPLVLRTHAQLVANSPLFSRPALEDFERATYFSPQSPCDLFLSESCGMRSSVPLQRAVLQRR